MMSKTYLECTLDRWIKIMYFWDKECFCSSSLEVAECVVKLFMGCN